MMKLAALTLCLVVSAPAAANVLCKKTDAKQVHLRQSTYVLLDVIDTPWVTFHSSATEADCHTCLRAYEAQLGLLASVFPTLASPKARLHEMREAVVRLVDASEYALGQCKIAATPKLPKRLTLCKAWPEAVRELVRQIVLSEMGMHPFTAHQILFYRMGALVRECALNR